MVQSGRTDEVLEDDVLEIDVGGDRPVPDKTLEGLETAADHFGADRFREALAVIKPLVGPNLDSAAVTELHGLILYRLGRYEDAIDPLERFAKLTTSVEQNPVLADCYRATGNSKRADALCQSVLASLDADAELVIEARLVLSGLHTDKDDIPGAIEALAPPSTLPKAPSEANVRQWYAFADLVEKAGDLPRARRLFAELTDRVGEYLDCAERIADLS